MSTTVPASAEVINEVRLIGRVSQAPEQRQLPSGDLLWTFRLVVPRVATSTGRRGAAARPGVDTIDCAVWTARCRRAVSRWRPGDVVEVGGALRRRFYRAGPGVSSRFEVEVASARLIRRPTSA